MGFGGSSLPRTPSEFPKVFGAEAIGYPCMVTQRMVKLRAVRLGGADLCLGVPFAVVAAVFCTSRVHAGIASVKSIGERD